VCAEKKADVLVLDEALGACSTGLLNETKLLQFLKAKPAGLEVVLTGRNPSPALLEAADYVSEICKRKHPYDKGITARDGIER
jgi:cob(I)alamin adenosyltransferase